MTETTEGSMRTADAALGLYAVALPFSAVATLGGGVRLGVVALVVASLATLLACTPFEPVDEPSAEHALTLDFAAVDPADLNFAWSGDGDAALLPERAFDDVQTTPP